MAGRNRYGPDHLRVLTQQLFQHPHSLNQPKIEYNLKINAMAIQKLKTGRSLIELQTEYEEGKEFTLIPYNKPRLMPCFPKQE